MFVFHLDSFSNKADIVMNQLGKESYSETGEVASRNILLWTE